MEISNLDKKTRFKEWVNEHTDTLYSWAFHKTQSIEIAEDLIQDAFLSAYRSIDSFREDSKASTWLFTILNRTLLRPV